jgi:hypothetical protein
LGRVEAAVISPASLRKNPQRASLHPPHCCAISFFIFEIFEGVSGEVGAELQR